MIILKPYIFIPFLFIAFGVWFKSSAPSYCPWLSTSEQIFVLTGDARRIPFAMEKLDGFPARTLFVIGTVPDYMNHVPEQFRAQTRIEYHSRTTQENAIAIGQIVRENNLRRITIVTTEDHIPRAMMLMRRHAPNTEIIACPVPLSNMDAARQLDRWLNEYIKWLGTSIGIEGRK